jgi:hypothetical protein
MTTIRCWDADGTSQIVGQCADAILARVEHTYPRSLDRGMLIEEIGKAFAAWADLDQRMTALQKRLAVIEARLGVR